jgi:fucose 4-O-acetylase-like acetyltransferase
MATERIVPLDRARTFITLLVVLHHSVVNYTYFGNGDPMRWLGFDPVVLFNDSFFMACMFFISGLFVRDSLARRGSGNFLASRAWRLGVPFSISIFVVTPIAYYPTFLRYHPPATTDFNFFHFWWHTVTIGPWPSGRRGSCGCCWRSVQSPRCCGRRRPGQSKRLGNSFMPRVTGR